VQDNNLHILTSYKEGFQYLQGKLEFFPTTEGYVKAVYNYGSSTPYFQYVYNYTDHLGNIRLSYTYSDKMGYKILQENHYYPFGLKHQNYTATLKKLKLKQENNNQIITVRPAVEAVYNYKYNGKELQDEFGLDWYDYGARMYDPATGRFMVVDPLAEIVNNQSVYVIANNNPIFYIDVFGLSSEPPEWWKKFTDFFRKKGRKRWHHGGGKVGKLKGKSYSFFNKRKKSKRNNTVKPIAKAVASNKKNYALDKINIDIDLNPSYEIPEIYLTRNNDPIPPHHWWDTYEILSINQTINISYMNDPRTRITTMLNRFKSGRELAGILKTLNSDPKLKLYIKLAKIDRYGNAVPTNFLKKQAQSLINYLNTEGISNNQIKTILHERGRVNSHIYIGN